MEKTDLMKEYLNKYYSRGDLLEPVFLKCPELDLEEIFLTLSECAEEGILHEKYRVCCPFCYAQNNKLYEKESGIPEQVLCRRCGSMIENAREQVLLLYEIA